jgi:hypothetical protein
MNMRIHSLSTQLQVSLALITKACIRWWFSFGIIGSKPTSGTNEFGTSECNTFVIRICYRFK